MTNYKYGIYKGQAELEPGKTIYRHKGSFASEKHAREYQQKLSEMGKKAKVIKFTDGPLNFSVYVIAPMISGEEVL
jgi:hypothetical protein